MVFSRRTELHTLREVVIRSTYESIRRNYFNTATASYFAELVDLVTELEHPVPEIYSLLLRAFSYLDNNTPDIKAILFFETELTKCLGLYTPDLPSAADRFHESFGRMPKTRSELLRMARELESKAPPR